MNKGKLQIRKSKKYHFSFKWAFIITIMVIGAQSEEYKFKHNLDEYVKYALEHNPMIDAAGQMIVMEQEEKHLKRQIPDPTVMVMFMDELDNDAFGPGKFTVSQMFPWPGKIKAKGLVADKTILSMEFNKKDKEIMLAFNVRKAYVSLYTVGKKIEYSKQSLELLKHMESVMLSKYASAMGSQMSLLKLQVMMAMVENMIINMEEMGNKIRYMLEAMLNTSAARDFPFPDTLPQLVVPKNFENVREISLLNNPLILKQQEHVKEAEAMVNMAKQMYAPNFMASVTYSRAEYDMSNMGAMMPLMPGAHMHAPDGTVMPMYKEQVELKGGVGFGLSLVAPIWFGINKARLNKARAMFAAQKAKLKKEENDLSKDIGVFLTELDDAKRQIALLENVMVPKASQALELVTEMYKIGNSSILEFLDAEKTLLDLQIQMVDQLKRREITAAEIFICCLANVK